MFRDIFLGARAEELARAAIEIGEHAIGVEEQARGQSPERD
jgi:hypothetical protein